MNPILTGNDVAIERRCTTTWEYLKWHKRNTGKTNYHDDMRGQFLHVHKALLHYLHRDKFMRETVTEACVWNIISQGKKIYDEVLGRPELALEWIVDTSEFGEWVMSE